jgi:murein DD-endopeptidase MepM/ murein hydrolase activator NlpD
MTGPLPTRHARTFAIGAACGFAVGAFLVASIVWQFGNVFGTRAAAARQATAPAAIDRWSDGLADVDSPVLEQGEPPAATSLTAPPALTREVPGRAAAAPPPDLAARDLEIPVEGVHRDQLVRSFDERRGDSRAHEAIDILAPRNTPVHAVEDGRIARLFYSKAGGTTIYQFDPTELYCYYYAHLERYADGLQEGDRVSKGQVLGYVGTSGNAPKDTPHLHFAVFRLTAEKHWWEGTPIDPYGILHHEP